MRDDPETRFAAAIGGLGYGGKLAVAGTSLPNGSAGARALDPEAILLGVGEHGAPLGLDLARMLDGRLMIQGVSGAGKSWLLRRLLEQTAVRIQQIVIDPEDEFRSLAEELGHLHVEAHRLDASAMAILAERVRAQRLSVVLDFSDLDRGGQMQAFAAFIAALIDCPRELWSTAIVAIDEAQLFAPKGAMEDLPPALRKASIGALVDLMGRGRKRGLVGAIATTRLAQLALSVASPIQNMLVGMNTLDLDIKRASETIGWTLRKASDRLPLLEPGQFVAVGRAFSQSPEIARIGAVRSRHLGAAPVIAPPAAADADRAREMLGIEGLIGDSARARAEAEDAAPPSGMRAVRMFVRSPGFALAGPIYAALRPLFPAGAALADLSAHLGAPAEDVAAAVVLLESYGIAELTAIDGKPSVRIDGEFGKWRL